MMMRVWGLILLALTLGGCSTNITMVHRSLDRLAPGATGSLTAGIPARPMLLVDLPSAINHGVVDAAGRWFVTGGEDKTAVVWSVDQGHQVAVLRPPVGEGRIGELTAIAITPDGGTVALGWRSADAGAILLFDRASARLTGRIAGLINVVTDLKISPNGSLIAATTAGGGLQVFDLPGGTERGRDAPYGDDATSVDFSPDGTRIVTVAFDGLVRLYSIDGGRLTRLMAKDITLTGLGLGPPSKPSLVRYSPDGSTIAVGYHNVFGQAEMLDAKSLAQIGKVWWRGNRSNASPIAWSADGRSFYAGGYDAEGVVVRRTLPVDMGGAKKEFNTLSPSADIRIPEKNGYVTTLQPLRSGGFLIATRGGNWGVLGVDNKIAWRQGAVVDRFANYVAHAEAPPQLLLSHDASQVAFSYAGRMGSAADTAFDVGSRRVSADMAGLLPARTQAPGFALATYQPAMAPHDYVTGYAITPDGKGVALSSLFATSFFSIDGRLLWRRPFRSFAVNVSPDGRWVVTDDREGLRWFRVRDGQEVMRFTPAAGGKKWILATPEGYFDASVGGEDILGWQVNHGVEQAADFYPVSLLRKDYYRPDIVTSALSRDGAPARPQAMPDIAGLLPPTIRIVSPDDGNAAAGSPVSVRYAVRSRPGQDVWIKVRFDGRPEDDRAARGARSAAAGEVQDSIRVTPPAGTQTVELLAESDTGVSLPAVLRLRPAPVANPVRPKLYVLAIGVSAYARQALKLGYPAKDADDFARVMKTHGRLYRDSDIRVLSDATATRARIIDGLKWLRAAPGPGDMAMLFMAGHGASGPAGAYYYLPQDADPADLQRTGVSNRDLIEAVSAIRGRVILFLDTCHAGATLSARNTGLVNELIKAENGAVVFASSTGDQFSLEHPDWGNGAFTKELVAGLAGGADPFRKGSVSVADLNSWLSARVPALTGGKQNPAFASPHTIADFAIAQ